MKFVSGALWVLALLCGILAFALREQGTLSFFFIIAVALLVPAAIGVMKQKKWGFWLAVTLLVATLIIMLPMLFSHYLVSKLDGTGNPDLTLVVLDFVVILLSTTILIRLFRQKRAYA
jgi:hypothetical protein